MEGGVGEVGGGEEEVGEGREMGEAVEEVDLGDARFHSNEGDSKVGEVGSRRGRC